MVIGTDTRCIHCRTPMRSCCLPAVCWRCGSSEAVQKREERRRQRQEEIRRQWAADSYERCPDYQI